LVDDSLVYPAPFLVIIAWAGVPNLGILLEVLVASLPQIKGPNFSSFACDPFVPPSLPIQRAFHLKGSSELFAGSEAADVGESDATRDDGPSSSASRSRLFMIIEPAVAGCVVRLEAQLRFRRTM
jgi:hypothetical protein